MVREPAEGCGRRDVELDRRRDVFLVGPLLGLRGNRNSGNSAPTTPVLWWASAPTITFSSAVISGNSRMFWNVRAMPSLVIWYFFLRPSLRPSKRISPLVGW